MGLAARVEPSVERFVGAQQRKMLIDGTWVEAASGKTFETLNPATGAVLAHVAEGDAVSAGTVVGLAGSSGRSTGPHLHYEVRRRGRVLNPISFVRLEKRLRPYL